MYWTAESYNGVEVCGAIQSDCNSSGAVLTRIVST